VRHTLTPLFCVMILIMPVASFAGGCADVNNSGNLNLLDVAYIINHLYRGGPEFNCGASSTDSCGNVNGDSKINLMDVAYIINFLYRGGPAPNCGEVTDIDGNEYQIVTIGTQVWMAENLKVTHYRNGDTIPNVIDNSAWYSLNTGAYCEYENNIGNATTYGRLYNWYAANDTRNIAPAGWHVPSDDEWKQMEMFLGMSQAQADSISFRGNNEGGKLKETGTAHWRNTNVGATNESGFTALPGGYRSSGGDFHMLNDYALFWTKTIYSTYFAWSRGLYYSYATVIRGNSNNQYGFSVRCVKD
jgi:uncharacterized protein (TIGR02145 family)